MSDKIERASLDAGSNVYVRMRKADGALISNASEPEDKFKDFYFRAGSTSGAELIAPPYDLASLREACRENPTLAPCVSTMEVNIDGTGYYFVDDEGELLAQDSKEVAEYIEFTDQVYTHMDFLSLRRLLRRDLEETGNWYIEVIRNLMGEIVFLRRIAPEDMRLARLSDPIEKTIKVKRKGVEVDVKMMVRERRFAQLVNKTPMYFAEFGASRALNKDTGQWEGQKGDNDAVVVVPEDKKATEIIHGTLDKDSKSPYGLPRWISAHRAVRGQVEAEELNLAFFDSGGVPPVLVTVTGGELTKQAKEALRMIFSGKAKQKLEGAVIEAESTSGSIDKEGRVDVTVHQFGDKSDSMFDNYDAKCEQKIRKTFRLPKLFMGDIDGINFATAYTMYMVTETQVFEPERLEFDSIMNRTIFADTKSFKGGVWLKSKPLNLKNVENRLKAIEMAKREGGITTEALVELLNQETALNMSYDQTALDAESDAAFEKQKARIDATMSASEDSDPLTDSKNTGKKQPVAPPAQKSEQARTDPMELIELSTLVVKASLEGEIGLLKQLGKKVEALTDSEFNAVKQLCYHNLLHNEVGGNALALVFPEWEGVTNGEGTA